MRRSSLPAALALAGLAVLGSALPAAAHGDSIHFAITAQGDGHTRAIASYDDDNDPVDQPVTGTLSAVAADGRTVGPWQLVPVAGVQAAYTTAEALPPGHWKVTVESAFPDLGHGEAEADVTAVPEGPAPSAAAPSVTAPSTAPAPARSSAAPEAAAPTSSHSGGSGAVIGGTVAAVVVVAAAVAAVLHRKRRSIPAGRGR
ncbi:hypothetical protein [Kitasatospora sp. NPDC001175]|uniref:hypothetical protein n=1 Tax=Kitasatospora sp. NPDC001175 TaxID=3157103 RepID=UPI003D01516A